jgi:predicted nucleic acid-binding protein
VYSKVYFDTAPLIYFLDKRDPYFSKVENFIYTLIIENTKLVTSVVTDMECLVIPYRENNKQKIRAYTDFMNYVDFERISVFFS